MKKILFVNCCISVHEESRTRKLAQGFLEAFLKNNSQSEIEEVDLMKEGLQPLDPDMIRRRNELSDSGAKGAEEFLQAERFAAADIIVIAAPYWEMSFPALLRIYIEHISALNVTFGYSDKGEQIGLCRAKHMVYLTTAGGFIDGKDYGGDYLRAMCEVYGISEFFSVAAEGLDIQGADVDAEMARALRQAESLAAQLS